MLASALLPEGLLSGFAKHFTAMIVALPAGLCLLLSSAVAEPSKSADAAAGVSSPTMTTSQSQVAMPESAAAPAATSKLETGAMVLPSTLRPEEGLAFTYTLESYLNRETPPAGVPDYGQLGAEFKTRSQGRFFEGMLHLGGSFATAIENYSNIYVPEAYLMVQSENFAEAEVDGDTRARLSLGRRLEDWSRLDRHWDLGLWEPLNRFDALRPIDQGMTGGFIEGGIGDLKLIVFASGIYVPEQNGGFTLRNGRIKSSSPWFTEPTDRLALFPTSTTEIHYDIRTPSTGSVISHASAAGLLRYGNFDEGLYVQTSYAFKPRNQLATPFEGFLDLTETTNYASVGIEPKVVYHQLVGGELGYHAKFGEHGSRLGFGVSALYDQPDNQDPGPNLTYQVLDPLLLLSSTLDGEFYLGSAVDFGFGVSYLHSEGGGATMRGPFASDKPVFGPRVPYREAVAVDMKVTFGSGRRSSFSLGTRWLEELSESGSLLMGDINYDFSMNGVTQDWRVSVLADLLGSQLPANDNRGYISRYRGNDRWIGQLRFIF